MEQICWSCANCTNGNLCVWVRKKKLPPGATQDNNNFIITCPNYEYDNMTETRTKQEIANELGIHYITYCQRLKLEKHYKYLVYYLKKLGIEQLSILLKIPEKRILDYRRKVHQVPNGVYNILKNLKEN